MLKPPPSLQQEFHKHLPRVPVHENRQSPSEYRPLLAIPDRLVIATFELRPRPKLLVSPVGVPFIKPKTRRLSTGILPHRSAIKQRIPEISVGPVRLSLVGRHAVMNLRFGVPRIDQGPALAESRSAFGGTKDADFA